MRPLPPRPSRARGCCSSLGGGVGTHRHPERTPTRTRVCACRPECAACHAHEMCAWMTRVDLCAGDPGARLAALVRDRGAVRLAGQHHHLQDGACAPRAAGTRDTRRLHSVCALLSCCTACRPEPHHESLRGCTCAGSRHCLCPGHPTSLPAWSLLQARACGALPPPAPAAAAGDDESRTYMLPGHSRTTTTLPLSPPLAAYRTRHPPLLPLPLSAAA
jgi:hypothetical protein